MRRAYVPFPAIPRIYCSDESRRTLQDQMNSLLCLNINLCDAFYEVSHVERSALATGGPAALSQGGHWHNAMMAAIRRLKMASQSLVDQQEDIVSGSHKMLLFRPDWLDELQLPDKKKAQLI